MKIIDFERKGHLVRFYLGANDCTDYHGDDWDDVPYDCNAGVVYDEYIQGTVDITIPFDSLVLEPSSEWNGSNTYWSKDDMKRRSIPCLIVVPYDLHHETWCDRFEDWVNDNRVEKFYFGDMIIKKEIEK